jgi:hypothetical protein
MISWYAQFSLVGLKLWKGTLKNSYLRTPLLPFSKRTTISSSSISSVMSRIFCLVEDTFFGIYFSSSSDSYSLTTLSNALEIWSAWWAMSTRRMFYADRMLTGITD